MRSATNGDRSAVPLSLVPSGGGDGTKAGRRCFRGAVPLLGMLAILLRPAAPPFSVSSFLVAERPDRLLIYNKYQQQITPRERAILAPFVPMRIVRNDDLLGDGFTPCMTVEIAGAFFYLVKGKEGELAGADRAGAIRRFSDVAAIGDTVTVLTNGLFQVALPVGEARRSIRRGDRLVRYFQEGDRTYVGTLDQSPIYGFTRLPASARGQSWNIARNTIVEGPTEIPQRVLNAVRENIEEVNRVYQGLYVFFNKQTSEQRPVPRWTMSGSQRTIVCTLNNRPSGADLSQSTKYLVKDLENALLGTRLRVSGTPDHIEIRMEQEE